MITSADMLQDIKNRVRSSEVEELDLRHFQENEVGLSHWDNNSVIAIRDNGCVDIFVQETTGIRLDPQAQSANFFSPKINLFGTRTHIRTNPYNFLWNGWKFNPEMYEWCKRAPLSGYKNRRNFRINCSYDILGPEGWETVHTEVTPYLKDNYKETYSPEVKSILGKLGIKL